MYEQIKGIIARQLDIDENTISESSLILEDLGADSLDVVEMLSEIEELASISIPDEDIPAIKSVGDLVNYVESHK